MANFCEINRKGFKSVSCPIEACPSPDIVRCEAGVISVQEIAYHIILVHLKKYSYWVSDWKIEKKVAAERIPTQLRKEIIDLVRSVSPKTAGPLQKLSAKTPFQEAVTSQRAKRQEFILEIALPAPPRGVLHTEGGKIWQMYKIVPIKKTSSEGKVRLLYSEQIEQNMKRHFGLMHEKTFEEGKTPAEAWWEKRSAIGSVVFEWASLIIEAKENGTKNDALANNDEGLLCRKCQKSGSVTESSFLRWKPLGAGKWVRRGQELFGYQALLHILERHFGGEAAFRCPMLLLNGNVCDTTLPPSARALLQHYR